MGGHSVALWWHFKRKYWRSTQSAVSSCSFSHLCESTATFFSSNKDPSWAFEPKWRAWQSHGCIWAQTRSHAKELEEPSWNEWSDIAHLHNLPDQQLQWAELILWMAWRSTPNSQFTVFFQLIFQAVCRLGKMTMFLFTFWLHFRDGDDKFIVAVRDVKC